MAYQLPLTLSGLEGHFCYCSDKSRRAVPLHLRSFLFMHVATWFVYGCPPLVALRYVTGMYFRFCG